MSNKRYIELDALRSIAILGMIIYHTAYDLQMFYGWDIDVFSSRWKIFQIAVASLFLLLVGITSSFSTSHPFKRCMRIGAAALLVSIVTFAIDPETYVRFGILHLIAISALLVPVLVLIPARRRAWLIIPGILLPLLGPSVLSTFPSSYLLLPLGVRPEGFISVDYFPLIPWFGVILIGYVIGDLFYNKLRTEPVLSIAEGSDELREKIMETRSSQLSVLAAPGRHSLLLYLIHQPIIIGMLWIALGTPNF